MYFLTQPLLAVGLTLCPISVVGPLSAGSLIIASMAGARYLGEEYTRLDKIGVALALLGTIGIVIFGPKINDVEDQLFVYIGILHFWNQEGLKFLVPLMFVLAVACGLVLKFVKHPLANIAFPIIAAIFGCWSEASSKLIGLWVPGGWTTLAENWPDFIGSLCLIAFFGPTSVALTTRGSEKFSQRFFLPAYVSMSATWLQILGSWGFGEWAFMPKTNRIFFVLCGVLCVCAVALSSASLKKDHKKEQMDKINAEEIGDVEIGAPASVSDASTSPDDNSNSEPEAEAGKSDIHRYPSPRTKKARKKIERVALVTAEDIVPEI
jgi:hypothetical protein